MAKIKMHIWPKEKKLHPVGKKHKKSEEYKQANNTYKAGEWWKKLIE